MAVIQILLDSQPGPLPLTGTFQPLADLPPTLFLTGTAQTSAPGQTIQVDVAITLGGQPAGGTGAVMMSNEAKQHKTLLALPANQKPWSFGQTYTYWITATGQGTISDANDYYSLTIVY